MNKKNIRVFEHQKLSISNSFTVKHYNSLITFGEKHGYKYFNVGRNSIKFKSYVGIIQVGKLIIEILPKTYKDHDINLSGDKCHDLLLHMIYRSGMLNLNHPDKANQQLQRKTLLDLFFKQFIKEAERLIHQGLKKQYRKEEANRTVLKGKLIFKDHIKKNIIHKERFYTSAESYDRDNIYNQIVKKALIIIFDISSNSTIKSDSSNLLLHLEDIKEVQITPKIFDRLNYTRHTQRYKEAIDLAKLIILQMMPDLSGGKNSVIAMLFNMNTLFELYITKELQRALPEYLVLSQKPQKYLLQNNITKENTFLMKPDIAIKKNGTILAILDAKWKLLNPEDKKRGVSQSDLYQLYTYSSEYGCRNVALLYPKWKEGQLNIDKRTFKDSENSLSFISLSMNNSNIVKSLRTLILKEKFMDV